MDYNHDETEPGFASLPEARTKEPMPPFVKWALGILIAALTFNLYLLPFLKALTPAASAAAFELAPSTLRASEVPAHDIEARVDGYAEKSNGLFAAVGEAPLNEASTTE